VDRASLDRQLELFTPWGMYRDPDDPMAYDHFARLWALDLLDEGYRGSHAAALETLVERGAWMSMFMQSPWGELPCGGRSAHHQWNEAQQAVTLIMGLDSRSAAMRRRPCTRRRLRCSPRALGRPSGELWIVKNPWTLRSATGTSPTRFTPNNLLAAMLAIAGPRR
jgi:hypothetical protein